MTVSICRACRGRAEVPEVHWAPCCSGRSAAGEVGCACAGMPEPTDVYVPCPLGCKLVPPPELCAPAPDPYCW